MRKSLNRVSGHCDVGVGKFGESAKRPTLSDVRVWTLHFSMTRLVTVCSIL